jgi:hypothetical protein
MAERHSADLDRAERLLAALRPRLALEAPDFDAALAAARDLAEKERAQREREASATDALQRLETDLFRRKSTRDRLAEAVSYGTGEMGHAGRPQRAGDLPHPPPARRRHRTRDLRDRTACP